MTLLAPDLFDRRFAELMEIGRARLPGLAPDWTDHNAHDPGITLMELLAWVAEAQLYSLSRRPRRDERAAYAALFGLMAGGRTAARGVIWPDRADPRSPVATFAHSTVIAADAVIHVVNEETPTFRPLAKLLFAPGRVQRVEARHGGETVDLTATNERGGTPYLPFGENAGPGDVLALTFRVRGEEGLFGKRRDDTKDALWAIGIRAAEPLTGNASSGTICRAPVTATLVAGADRIAIPIVSDTTNGLLETGALLLDLRAVAGSPGEVTIELRAPEGFARPPRWLRIEPNVVPIVQGRPVAREVHDANGLPDLTFNLEVPGLRFAAGEDPVTIEVAEPAGLHGWTRVERLAERAPSERVYELDPTRAEVTFGNGINGRVPPAGAQVLVSYAVCDAEKGNVARNRRWSVGGFDGVYGFNVDPVTGGAAPASWVDLRRAARRRFRDEHALVSSDDIAGAAKALPLLEVARAWVLPAEANAPRTGVVTLVAMRARLDDVEPARIPETRRWLEAIRRRLAPRMPLGARLVVTAPAYADFVIRATVNVEAGRDPLAIKTAIEREMSERLALTERRPGVPLARRDAAAWMRGVDGVKSVGELQFARSGQIVSEINVSRGGLPRLDLSRSSIEVKRS